MLIMATITANLRNYNADLLWHTTKIVSGILQNLLEMLLRLVPKENVWLQWKAGQMLSGV